jgi:transposase
MYVGGTQMKRFIQSENRNQFTLLPECLDDYISEDNPVCVIDWFVDEQDLIELGFDDAEPASTGKPGYHPSLLLKIYICGYLNRIQSSRQPQIAPVVESSAPRLDVRRCVLR